REPVDLFVVLRLDVAAREEAIDAIADAQVVAVVQRHRTLDHPVVDECAVGAAQVGYADVAGFRVHAAVLSGNRVIRNTDLAVFTSADLQGLVSEGIPCAHLGAGGVNVNEAGGTVRGHGPPNRCDPCLGDWFFHQSAPAGTGASGHAGASTPLDTLL